MPAHSGGAGRGQQDLEPVGEARGRDRADDAAFDLEELGVVLVRPERAVHLGLLALHVAQVLREEAADRRVQAASERDPLERRGLGEALCEARDLEHAAVDAAVIALQLGAQHRRERLQQREDRLVFVGGVLLEEGEAPVHAPLDRRAGVGVGEVGAGDEARGLEQLGAQALVDGQEQVVAVHGVAGSDGRFELGSDRGARFPAPSLHAEHTTTPVGVGVPKGILIAS